MLVYKGVLHLPYGEGNGEIFNSLPFVLEKREDYEAPSEEMRRETRRLLRRIRRKSLTDDELFRLAMYDNPVLADFFASAYVPDYERGGITRVISDYEIPTASTKSSRLDALAEAGDTVIDFEMESGVRGDVLKRTRQYVANLTNSFILKGGSYMGLPRIVIVFFVPYDILGKGKPFYVIRPRDEDGEVADPDDVRIYVNWKYEGEDKYGMIAHDIRCADAGKMHYNEIRARMSALKDEEGGEKMAEDIFARMRREGREEGREEGRAEGRAEGRNEVRSDFVKILLKDTSPSEISRKFNIPLSEVRAIERSLRA